MSKNILYLCASKKKKIIFTYLQREGIYALGITYPAVSKKEARIRLNVQATHKKEHFDKFMEALCKIDNTLKIRQ